jgi:sulfate permease, SulP family
LENVPFYHALASTVIQDLGYGMDALSTLVFLFGLSSIMVGATFYLLGRFKLGRFVYFFPGHVLVGCIGGIGIFIAITSVSVTNNVDFTFDADGLRSFVDNIHLFGIVLVFETVLRILMSVLRDSKGRPTFALLAPVYFCSIVPVFYLGMYLLGVDMDTAREAGYFFPSPIQAAANCHVDELGGPGVCQGSPSGFPGSVFDGHVLDMFRIIDVRRIAWTTVIKSFGTVVAMTSFSLIHVPINIPAFAVSSNVDTDMNAELLAHGYSNMLSGLFGGLQTIMTYSFSVLYMKSGGKGRASSLGVTFVGILLFIFGPQISAYIPRCMAGTLLLHVGLDLFLEGIVDSWGSYDYLEYSGIVFIALVMTVSGMTSALLAGIIAALSTYAVQSITNLDPIFRIMSASTLRSSSAWTRSPAANAILDCDDTGRARVLIVQLQGHLFFGNVASLTDTIKHTLILRRGCVDEPYIVILDFTLVVGMDSSAAHAVAKLKRIMHTLFNVEVTMFVSGSHRSSFPCDYALAEALSKDEDKGTTLDFNDVDVDATPKPARAPRGSVCITPGSKAMEASKTLRRFPRYHVCDSLDKALEFAEDVLVARRDPLLFQKEKIRQLHPLEHSDSDLTLDDERILATLYLENLAASSPISEREVKQAVSKILSLCRREEFTENQLIWKQGDKSDSMKVLVRGKLLANLAGTDVSEVINQGSTIGELGLVQGGRRLSTVVCSSSMAVAYSLDRTSWEQLVRKHPSVARVVDLIVIRYLSQRVQHVSNRIFETRCLPI